MVLYSRTMPELVKLEALQPLLDAAGVAPGAPLTGGALIGDGHSNVTALLERDGRRLVLRRPPQPPYPPKAHDVLREARILQALAPTAVPVPEVVATCDDTTALGVPFYVMDFLDGEIVTDETPPSMRGSEHAVANGLVDTLVALHRVDPAAVGLEQLGRAEGYLERQLKTFASIWEAVHTREVPLIGRLHDWLAANLPSHRSKAAIVHGDYRLGNLMFDPSAPGRVLAVMDWEMATLGDPLADVGYLSAMYADSAEAPNVMTELGAATFADPWPPRQQLLDRYAEQTGASLDAVAWYEALALWKACVFLESSHRRWREGTTTDPWFAQLETGVPALAEAAWRRT